jgi:hypothetical protein
MDIKPLFTAGKCNNKWVQMIFGLVHPKLTLVGTHDFPGEIQAKTGAGNTSAAGRVYAIETFEDALPLLFRDKAPGVGKGGHGMIVSNRQAEADQAAFSVELDYFDGEPLDGHLQHIRIGLHHPRSVVRW